MGKSTITKQIPGSTASSLNGFNVVCFRSGSKDRSIYDQFIDSAEIWEKIFEPNDRIIRFPRSQASRILKQKIQVKNFVYMCAVIYYQLCSIVFRKQFIPIFSDGVGRFRFGFRGKGTSPLVFWWNDDSQIIESITMWKFGVRKTEYKHVVTNLIHELNLPSNHKIVMSGSFCFAKLSQNTLRHGEVKRAIVFAGNIDLSGREIFRGIANRKDRDHFRNYAQLYAREISENGVSIHLISRWKNFLEDLGPEVGNCINESWLYLGNLVRNEFLKKVCTALPGRNFQFFVNYQGVDIPSEIRNYLKVPNYEIMNFQYQQSLISFDFGSRWMNKPVACYERTTKIITNGFGLVRFADVKPSPLFTGLDHKRQFENIFDLVNEVTRMENLDTEEWMNEGKQIRANYLGMQTEQLAELKRHFAKSRN
jgi:hypothetical protein